MKKAAALVLFLALGTAASLPASAQSDQNSARQAALRHNQKQSRKYVRQQKKQTSKIIRAQKKAQKKQHHS